MPPQQVSRVADAVVDIFNNVLSSLAVVVDNDGSKRTTTKRITNIKPSAATTGRGNQGNARVITRVPATATATVINQSNARVTTRAPTTARPNSGSVALTASNTGTSIPITLLAASEAGTKPSSSNGLSPGIIAGITVPVVLLTLTLIAIGIYWWRRRHHYSAASAPGKGAAGAMNRDSSSSSGKTDSSLKEHESGYYDDTAGNDSMAASNGRPNGSEQGGSYFGGSRAEQGNIAELSDTGLSEIDGTQRSSELYEGLPVTREISEIEGDTPMTEVGGGQRWEMRNSIKEEEEDAPRTTQPSRTMNAETS